MERQRSNSIRRDGAAYGYGLEEGRRRAASDAYKRKREESEQRRDPFGMRRIVYGSSREPKYHEMELSSDGERLLGMPQRKRRKRR